MKPTPYLLVFDDGLEDHADQQAGEPLVTAAQRQHQTAGGPHVQAVLDLVVQEREPLAACGEAGGGDG